MSIQAVTSLDSFLLDYVDIIINYWREAINFLEPTIRYLFLIVDTLLIESFTNWYWCLYVHIFTRFPHFTQEWAYFLFLALKIEALRERLWRESKRCDQFASHKYFDVAWWERMA